MRIELKHVTKSQNHNIEDVYGFQKVNVSNLKRIIAHVRKKPELMKDPDVISQFKLLKNIERRSKDTGQYTVQFFLKDTVLPNKALGRLYS